MKHLIFILAFVTMAASIACHKFCPDKGVPKCVQEKIKDFKETSCKEDANVKEYKFQGDIVYVFDPGSCGADMTSEVINKHCKTLGYLGGITGNTIINGEDFSHATYIRTVWKR